MADNVRTSAGSSDGATFAADDIGPGVYYPRIKLTLGADGVNDGDVSSSNPIPVSGAILTTIDGHVDGIETLLGTTNSALSTIDGHVDGIETLIGTTNSSLTTLAGYLDGVEALIGTTNSSLATITTAVQLIDNAAVDHDAAAVAGVFQVGLEARNTEPTAVSTTGDAVRALGTMLGKQVTMPYALPSSTWSYAAATSGITNTSDVAAQSAGAAGVRHYVTGVQVINAHATVGTEVVIKDGSTVMWRGYAAPVGGGVSAKFDPPLRGTAATAINVANITTGSATYFNLQGFDSKE